MSISWQLTSRTVSLGAPWKRPVQTSSEIFLALMNILVNLGNLASPNVVKSVAKFESRSLSILKATMALKKDNGTWEVALTARLRFLILNMNAGGMSFQNWRGGQGFSWRLVRLVKAAKKEGGTAGKVGGEEWILEEKSMETVVIDGGKETESKLPTDLARVLMPRKVSFVWKEKIKKY